MEGNAGGMGILKGPRYKHLHSNLIWKPRNRKINLVYYEVHFFSDFYSRVFLSCETIVSATAT